MIAFNFIVFFVFSPLNLASMLGISTYAAKKVIDIIDTFSTIATIISIVTAIIGTEAITAGIVAVAKKMIKKYGKKYATMW
ncbi:uberolysin/carnocyclin family circular bacteriocin [Marinitoga sp. 1197]|uniref:uberolysin/carnocyclin family circular bacteriocin n=1 Tax=Marinitoga sp. 1197 TaxID=1428449 RepID=UPI003FA58DBB